MNPTFVSVDEELLRAAVIAIAAGIESTESLLADHVERFGKTTRKNFQWATTLENDIELMNGVKKSLRASLGWPELETK